MLEDLRGDDALERSIAIGQCPCVTDDGLSVRRRGCLTGIGYGAKHGVDLVQLDGVLVEGHHIGTAPISLKAVPARPAPDVDDLGAVTDTEAVEVHRQHGSPTAWAGS